MRFIMPALLLATAAAGAAATQRPPARPALGFTLDISYSPRAAAEMARRREALTISAYYEGEPSRAGARHTNGEDGINLGDDTRTVPARSGPVAVTGRGFLPARLAWTRAGTIRVNVNLFSARRSGPDNILDCGVVEGPLARIAGRTHPVRCKLIGEP
jgi:hypothetical protein